MVVSFYLNELEVLRDRIDLDVSVEFNKDREPSYIPYFVLLTDVHFYVIAWVNLDKSLSRLYKVTDDIRVENIRQKRKKWFDTMRRARNSIEHIDERAIKYPEVRNTPNIMQVLGKRTAVVYGERIDIGHAGEKRIDSISVEIQRWLGKYLISLQKEKQ